jgi:hypothetical protein
LLSFFSIILFPVKEIKTIIAKTKQRSLIGLTIIQLTYLVHRLTRFRIHRITKHIKTTKIKAQNTEMIIMTVVSVDFCFPLLSTLVGSAVEFVGGKVLGLISVWNKIMLRLFLQQEIIIISRSYSAFTMLNALTKCKLKKKIKKSIFTDIN